MNDPCAVASQQLSPDDHSWIEKGACEEDLRCFVDSAWSILEPATHFDEGRHIDAICEHLQTVALTIAPQAILDRAGFKRPAKDKQIKHLLINIPPRCMKSLLVCVFFPAWVWTWWPEARFVYSSYSGLLSLRDSRKTRDIIKSRWYQSHWDDTVQIAGDNDSAGYFSNTAHGVRIATSVGAMGTGEGGNFVIFDDPHNAGETESDVKRDSVIRWWDERMASRLNDRRHGAFIGVMQRLHERDLSGHLIEKGNYVHLCLPMEYEPDRHCKTPIFDDWRKEPGELLWPDHIGTKELDELKADLCSQYAIAGQLQQRPAPRGGGDFQREWFEIVRAAPAKARRVRYWDFAATEKKQQSSDPDYTAGALLAIDGDGMVYIEDMRRVRASSLAVEQLVRQTAELDGMDVAIWLEQEPGSAGKSLVNYYIRKVLQGFNVHAETASGPKPSRWAGMAAQAEVGNIKLVKGAWNSAFLDEAEVAPAGAHDDQLDAAAGAFNKLVAKKQAGAWGRKKS